MKQHIFAGLWLIIISVGNDGSIVSQFLALFPGMLPLLLYIVCAPPCSHGLGNAEGGIVIAGHEPGQRTGNT